MARKKGRRTRNQTSPVKQLPGWMQKEHERFEDGISRQELPAAIGEYHSTLDRLLQVSLEAELAGDKLACAAGCTTCCHQPLVLSFIELAELFFSDEQRFSGAAFKKSLQVEIEVLNNWRARGADTPAKMARTQWDERRPCIMLGRDDRCTVYSARPFLCRNLFARKICHFGANYGFGFGNLSHLARCMRESLHNRFKLSRFDTAETKTRDVLFYLPEGMLWLLEKAPLDRMRPLFCPPAAEASTP